MCLGIPMRIIESDGFTALCEGRGEERRVNMMLVDEAAPETWGIVHMGNAVHILDAGEAARRVRPAQAAYDKFGALMFSVPQKAIRRVSRSND